MNTQPSIRSEIIIVLLAIVSVILVIVDVSVELAPADRLFLDRVDLAIALVFLTEWLWRFARAEERGAFFRRSWWELLASIPLTHEMAQSLRGLRLLRVVRLFRILRVVRLAIRLQILFARSQRLAGETHLISIATTAAFMILGATLGFHVFEVRANPGVENLFDSFWWAMCTVTTVGYGDVYPMTSGGRMIGLLLMVFGAGVMAAFTALVASYLVRNRNRNEDASADSVPAR